MKKRKAELTGLGYTIEDMHVTWGRCCFGQFRFMRDIDVDWGEIQQSEHAAWMDADQYQRQRAQTPIRKL